jgi:TolA-binding protein
VKKNLKKAIKEDEFVSGFEHLWQWVAEHGSQVRIGVAALAVVLIGAGALSYFRAQRDREAHDAFTSAVDTFHASVASEHPPSATPDRFATAHEKYQQALGEFQKIEQRYGSHTLGTRARYYEALCKIELGELDDAARILGDIASKRSGDSIEPALARLALADLERRRGHVDQAADAYKQIVEDPSALVPRDHALMSWAEALEQAKRLDEAKAAYQRLVEQFPASTYATDAKKRVEFLQARG